jgi:hypothetical protein
MNKQTTYVDVLFSEVGLLIHSSVLAEHPATLSYKMSGSIATSPAASMVSPGARTPSLTIALQQLPSSPSIGAMQPPGSPRSEAQTSLPRFLHAPRFLHTSLLSFHSVQPLHYLTMPFLRCNWNKRRSLRSFRVNIGSTLQLCALTRRF